MALDEERYISQLVTILQEAGKDGLRLHIIALTLYNMNRDIFSEGDDYESIRSWLSAYLRKQVIDRRTPFAKVKDKKTGRYIRGYYRIKQTV